MSEPTTVDTTARRVRNIRSLPQPQKKVSLPIGRFLFWGIMGGCGAGMAIIATMNIQPYRIAVTRMLGSMVSPEIIAWGPMQVILAIAGTLVFLALQAFEILPNLIKSSRSALLAILADVQSAPSIIGENEADSDIVRKLKIALNKMPEELIKHLFRLKSFAYAVDGAICWFIFPPFNKGVQFVGFDLFRDINWLNVLLIFLTVLAFEAICKVIGIVWGARFWIQAIGKEQ